MQDKKVLGYLKLSDESYLDYYFDSIKNNVKCEITRGNIYKVVRKDGYDCYEDITIIDDNNNELTLPDFFFKEPTLADIQNMNKVKVLKK